MPASTDRVRAGISAPILSPRRQGPGRAEPGGHERDHERGEKCLRHRRRGQRRPAGQRQRARERAIRDGHHDRGRQDLPHLGDGVPAGHRASGPPQQRAGQRDQAERQHADPPGPADLHADVVGDQPQHRRGADARRSGRARSAAPRSSRPAPGWSAPPARCPRPRTPPTRPRRAVAWSGRPLPPGSWRPCPVSRSPRAGVVTIPPSQPHARQASRRAGTRWPIKPERHDRNRISRERPATALPAARTRLRGRPAARVADGERRRRRRRAGRSVARQPAGPVS